jgi:hypothetical protein
VYGNRGCLHNSAGTIVRRAAAKRWIACRLSYRGWYGAALRGGRLLGLFFLDDATAFAAGHRPCALCRRDDYRRVLAVTGAGGAGALDAVLRHSARASRPRDHCVPSDGTFVMLEDEPHLVVSGAVRRYSSGYGPAVSARKPPRSSRSYLSRCSARLGPLLFLHPSAHATMTA